MARTESAQVGVNIIDGNLFGRQVEQPTPRQIADQLFSAKNRQTGILDLLGQKVVDKVCHKSDPQQTQQRRAFLERQLTELAEQFGIEFIGELTPDQVRRDGKILRRRLNGKMPS